MAAAAVAVVVSGLIVVLVVAGDDDGTARPPVTTSEVAAGVDSPPADHDDQPPSAQTGQSTPDQKKETARDQAGGSGSRNAGNDRPNRSRSSSGNPADDVGTERDKPRPSAGCPPGVAPETCAALAQSAQGGPSQTADDCPSPSAEFCRALEAAYGNGSGSGTSKPSECPSGLSATECEALAVDLRAEPSP